MKGQAPDYSLGDETDPPRQPATPTRGRWHIQPGISWGDLLLAGSMLLAGFSAWSAMERRVTIIEQAQAIQARVDSAQDAARQEALSLQMRIDSAQDQVVRDALIRIEGQLRDIQSTLVDRARRVAQ
jgi:TolA-binding protein